MKDQNEVRGIIVRRLVSGPVFQTPLALDTEEEGLLSIDTLLRPFEGKVVSITITEEEPFDAELERLSQDSDSKYSPRR